MPITTQVCPNCRKDARCVHDYRWTIRVGSDLRRKNQVVSPYQRYSNEWNQMARIRSVKAKIFTEITHQNFINTST